MTNYWRPAPSQVLLAGAVISLLIVLATIALALESPWLGVVFSPVSPDDALVVSRQRQS